MSGDFEKKTIVELHNGLKEKTFSCEELTHSYLEKIEKRQGDINGFITVLKEGAIESAKHIDKKIAEGKDISVLEGIPCAIKDNILVKNHLATAGSKILSNYKAAYDSTVTQKLKDNGAVFLGKANMDEFACGSSNETSYYGTVKNPYDLERVPGGSSGGSAAIVADNQAVYSLGSDTGGSIRQPAALCGLVGLKPTYGRVSRYGLIAMASSFDQIGPLTKNVEDSIEVFKSITGVDKKDATTFLPDGQATYDNNFEDIPKNVKGVKIGFDPNIFVAGVDDEIKNQTLASIEKLKAAGAQIVEIDLDKMKYALSTYYILMPAELSTNLSRLDGVRYGDKVEMPDLDSFYKKTRGDGFGDEVKRRIILGSYVLSHGYYDAYYKKAQKVRALLKQIFKDIFKEVDCIVTPTTAHPAFKIGEKINDPLAMYMEDIFTVSINVAGVPAISVPMGVNKNGLPLGLQFITKNYDERMLFQCAQAFELL